MAKGGKKIPTVSSKKLNAPLPAARMDADASPSTTTPSTNPTVASNSALSLQALISDTLASAASSLLHSSSQAGISLSARAVSAERIAEIVEAEMAAAGLTFSTAFSQLPGLEGLTEEEARLRFQRQLEAEIPPRLAQLQKQLEQLDTNPHSGKRKRAITHHHAPAVTTAPSGGGDELVEAVARTANQTEQSLQALRRRLGEVKQQLYGAGNSYYADAVSDALASVGFEDVETELHDDDFDSSTLMSRLAMHPDYQRIMSHYLLTDEEDDDDEVADDNEVGDDLYLQSAAARMPHLAALANLEEKKLGTETELEGAMAIMSSPHLAADAKLELVRERFAEVIRQDLYWRHRAQMAGRQAQEARLERQLVEMELDKAHQIKCKLDALCRDLQQENQRLKEVMMMTEDVKPADSSFSLPPLNEQAPLLPQLKQAHQAWSLREQHFTASLRTINLHMANQQARLHQAQTASRDCPAHERRIAALTRSEADLKAQVRQYVEKFRQVEETLAKSNELFTTFRSEMEQMGTKVNRLERENGQLHGKCGTLSRNIIEMADERAKQAQSMETLKSQKAKLEQLCRTLQAERNSALARLKALEPQQPVAAAEETSVIEEETPASSTEPITE